MSEPGSGQIVSSHLLKLVLGVVFLTALTMLACSGSGDGSVSTPTAPPGMFSTLPTSETAPVDHAGDAAALVTGQVSNTYGAGRNVLHTCLAPNSHSSAISRSLSS